jgi:hypothetical protein
MNQIRTHAAASIVAVGWFVGNANAQRYVLDWEDVPASDSCTGFLELGDSQYFAGRNIRRMAVALCSRQVVCDNRSPSLAFAVTAAGEHSFAHVYPITAQDCDAEPPGPPYIFGFEFARPVHQVSVSRCGIRADGMHSFVHPRWEMRLLPATTGTTPSRIFVEDEWQTLGEEPTRTITLRSGDAPFGWLFIYSWPSEQTSLPSVLVDGIVQSLFCPVDLDDGRGFESPDGGVTLDDLLYFLEMYSTGDARSDLDDGTGLGTSDGGVTIDGLFYFLRGYEAGC